MTREERLKQVARRLMHIQFASKWIQRLAEDVCPACKAREVFFCEIVDGVHVHAQSGACKASPILELLAHMDDVRHQFANEFNEEELPRVFWYIKTRYSDDVPESSGLVKSEE